MDSQVKKDATALAGCAQSDPDGVPGGAPLDNERGLRPVGPPEHVRGGYILTRYRTDFGAEITYISKDLKMGARNDGK